MQRREIHSVAARIMIALSVLALLLVMIGYALPPQSDENAAAHIFQLAIAALLPVGALFLASADWREPRHTLIPLGTSAGLVICAFAALYYLEHYWYAPR